MSAVHARPARASRLPSRAPAPPRQGALLPTRESEAAWERFGRTALDVLGSALALVVLLPLLLLLGVWVRLDSPGPALLRQTRVGLGGRPFTLYKFRTMRVDCDDSAHRALIAAELAGVTALAEGSTKVPHDTRVTRVGRLLRRTSLDELPQLLNVLTRKMSLVGPRPCLPWEAELFPVAFRERFTVRPGITGLWQVRGRTTLGTLDMLSLDVEYVRNRRLLGDVRILLATIPSMLRGDGAR